MSKANSILNELHSLEELAARNHWSNKVHPLAKLLITLLYIILVVSYNKYSIIPLLGMVLFLVVCFTIFELNFKDCLKRLRLILPFICIVGLFNPLFDKSPLTIYGITTTGGVISMLTLIMKGSFAVLASYCLIATTSIDKICYDLRLLHIPKIIVTQIMLTYRYISLLLKEVATMSDAYMLRSNGARGVKFKHWGSFAGLLLLRSIDRANTVYESMCLRGYNGDYAYVAKGIKARASDYIYFIFWLFVLILLRIFPVIDIVAILFA